MLDLSPIKKRLAAATPAPWESDTTKNEGEYGDGGPDSHEGFSSYQIIVEVRGKPEVLCDSLNSTIGEIHEDSGGDEAGDWHEAWDETARRNFDLIANAPADLAALVAEVERLRTEVAVLTETGLRI